LQRHHNHYTKDRVALGAVNESITQSALRAIGSTEVGGIDIGCYAIRNDLSISVVGASAIVKS
jgi:hypothetical protein